MTFIFVSFMDAKFGLYPPTFTGKNMIKISKKGDIMSGIRKKSDKSQ
jgi:hypothetical protein